MKSSFKKIIIITSSFIILLTTYIICASQNYYDYLYPHPKIKYIIIGGCLLLLFHLFYLLLLIIKIDRTEKIMFTISCSIIILPLMIMIFSVRMIDSFSSKTTDMNNYLIVDNKCKADYSFFPTIDEIKELDVEYYYYFEIDEPNKYEIKLTINLKEDEIEKYIADIEQKYGIFNNGEIELKKYKTMNNFDVYQKIIHRHSCIIYLVYCGYDE